MTKQEKIIVSAYTGVLMCNFEDVHEYIQKKFGRPVFTHELVDKGIQKEVKEKSEEEFLEICNREEPKRKKGRWVRAMDGNDGHVKCDKCFKTYDYISEAQYYKFCPNCGADMRGEEK